MKQTFLSKKSLFNGRVGEKIGGGYLILRRGKKTGRVSIKSTLPFEHPSYEAARAEADRLASLNPGETFVVFKMVTE